MTVYKELKEPSQYNPSFVSGFNQFSQNNPDTALPLFLESIKQCSNEDLKNKYKYLSYYGRTLFQMGEREKGLECCIEAAQYEKFHTDVFYNLAYVAKNAQKRELALKAIAQGKSINPYDTQLIHLRHSLGLRRKPVFSFLSRENILNIIIGKVTYNIPDKVDPVI